MATRNFAYDHPAYQDVKAVAIPVVAGNAAIARFGAFTNIILRSAQVTAGVLGTATTHAVTFRTITSTGSTTTSIGAVTLSTSAVGVTSNVSLGNAELAAGEFLTVTNGADATGVAVVTVEYQIKQGANVNY